MSGKTAKRIRKQAQLMHNYNPDSEKQYKAMKHKKMVRHTDKDGKQTLVPVERIQVINAKKWPVNQLKKGYALGEMGLYSLTDLHYMAKEGLDG